ncbi:MAG: hypothetical protein F6K17_42030, partial [Okeania sp. SIO3C4]|nr:hypothetical protein [Okeania sp. SIO3C4]
MAGAGTPVNVEIVIREIDGFEVRGFVDDFGNFVPLQPIPTPEPTETPEPTPTPTPTETPTPTPTETTTPTPTETP